MALRPQPSLRRSHRGQQLQQRNARVQAHLALVGPIASHYARCSPESTDDLDQVGRLGLIRAAELYDSQQNVPFSAYARRHVRGAILHYLRDVAPLVREPRRLQERRQRIREQERQMTGALGRRPSPEELRCSMALNDSQWRDVSVPADGWQQCWLEALEQEQAERSDPWRDNDSDSQRAERMRRALNGLEHPQRRLLKAVVLEGLSLRSVAKRQGMSLTTAHRHYRQALALLRTRLIDPSGAPAC